MSPTAFLAFYFDDLSSIMMVMTKIIVAAFYHFTSLEDPTSLRGPLLATLSSHGVRGTVLLAPEVSTAHFPDREWISTLH